MDSKYKELGYLGFMKHNGGFQFKKITDSEYQFRATVLDIHLNSGGVTHGGFIMSLMDSGMGTAAHRSLGPDGKATTITLDVKFIASSHCGDILMGSAKISKKTRSLIFIQGEIWCGENLIATAEGIWKSISPRY